MLHSTKLGNSNRGTLYITLYYLPTCLQAQSSSQQKKFLKRKSTAKLKSFGQKSN